MEVLAVIPSLSLTVSVMVCQPWDRFVKIWLPVPSSPVWSELQVKLSPANMPSSQSKAEPVNIAGMFGGTEEPSSGSVIYTVGPLSSILKIPLVAWEVRSPSEA